MTDRFGEYKHILFDADNTLLDFTKAERAALELTFQSMGIELPYNIYKLYVDINHRTWQEYEAGRIKSTDIPVIRFREFLQAANLDLEIGLISRTYQNLLSEQTFLMPYAEEICEYWSKKASISIITNGFKVTQERRIRTSKIWPYIKHLIISEDLGISKPDTAFFTKTFEILGRPNPRDVLVVGDSLSSDIKGAMNAGLDCCWYNPNGIELPGQYTVKYQIDKLEQLQV